MVRTNIKDSSVRRKDVIKNKNMNGIDLLVKRAKEIGCTPDELLDFLVDFAKEK